LAAEEAELTEGSCGDGNWLLVLELLELPVLPEDPSLRRRRRDFLAPPLLLCASLLALLADGNFRNPFPISRPLLPRSLLAFPVGLLRAAANSSISSCFSFSSR
jgi:hypothetical protein